MLVKNNKVKSQENEGQINICFFFYFEQVFAHRYFMNIMNFN